MKGYYSERALGQLKKEYSQIDRRANKLLLDYTYHRYTDDRASEYALQGFCRRVSTLRRCIQNIYKIIPPGAIRIPKRDRLLDAQINLQAFVANAYGCIDNLAWVWVYEQGLEKNIRRNRVGFKKTHTEVLASLPPSLASEVAGIDEWLTEYLTDFRDALAHRIPLYVPPGGVPPRNIDKYNGMMREMNEALKGLDSQEYDRIAKRQTKLLVWQPQMTHSINEARGSILFHPQLLRDFKTVELIANKMMVELKRLPQPPARTKQLKG